MATQVAVGLLGWLHSEIAIFVWPHIAVSISLFYLPIVSSGGWWHQANSSVLMTHHVTDWPRMDWQFYNVGFMTGNGHLDGRIGQQWVRLISSHCVNLTVNQVKSISPQKISAALEPWLTYKHHFYDCSPVTRYNEKLCFFSFFPSSFECESDLSLLVLFVWLSNSCAFFFSEWTQKWCWIR